MKKPEQLPLDFSEPSYRPHVTLSEASQVVSLESVRKRKQQASLGAVYDAIRDSIKHIDVRRPICAKRFIDSSFG